ncbi:MAG: Na+/H+ antiporter subunit E, partial [Cyclonatronaceae bacterium]
MTQLFSNVLLAFIWAAITGTVNLPNLVIGFFLGYIVMMIAAPAIDSYSYTRRMRKGIFFIFYFLKELVVSSVRVAIDVLRPRFNMESGIVAIPLTAK